MRLTHLQAVREKNQLVGWTARFTDEAGQTRIANLGLGCLMDPSAFAQAVARQGVRYAPPPGTDAAAWQGFVRELMAEKALAG